VTIAGVDCYLLMERIAMPVTYCKKYGRRKQLQFMALVQKPTSDVLQSQLLCMCRFRSDNYTCPHTTDFSYRSVLPLQGAVTLMEKSQQRDWRHNQTLNLYNVRETWITYEPKQTDYISLTISCEPTMLSCDIMADYMIWQGEVERNFNFSSIVYGKSESGDYFVDMITLTLDPWTIHRVPSLSYHGIVAPDQLDNVIRIICHHETSRHNNTHTVGIFEIRKDCTYEGGLISQPRILGDYTTHKEEVDGAGIGRC
jgi:hypothetical protein